MSNSQGFTLVEMAIVLVIMGILVGMGAGMITPLTTMTKTRETRESIAADRDSIISWAASNNRIPDNTLFPGIANIASDPWGQQFVYLYDPALSPPAPTKDTICGRRSTFLNISTHNPEAYIKNVAYVVASSGDNRAFLSTLTGGSSGIITNTAVSSATTIHCDRSANDIMTWVTLDELRSKVGCQGAQMKILNNELPYGSATSAAYAVTVTADGGVPFAVPNLYRWCVQTTSGTSPHANIMFTPNVFSINCAALAEGNWGQLGQLTISWPQVTAPASGSYSFTIFVRDNNANIASKAFVLTVNP